MLSHDFKRFCCNLLPTIYGEELSPYELVCKLLEEYNKMIDNYNEFVKLMEKWVVEIEQLKNDMDYLKNEMEKIKNGDYISNYIDALAKWIDDNLQEMVARIVKYVFFGLTDDGYFCANIPQVWEFIEFDTIVEQDNELYGHLVMRW